MNCRARHPRLSSHARRGMALVMVISVVAVCSVLGLALLARSSKQVVVAANVQNMSQARYAAESGLHLAMHYLQYPGEAPAGTTTSKGVYRGQNGIALASGQSADVTIADEGNYVYLITSTGHVSSRESSSDTTLRCRVQVFYQYAQTYAAGFPTNAFLPGGTVINGELRCDGQLWLENNTTRINGTARYRSRVGALGVITDPEPLSPSDALHFPALSQIRTYNSTYSYQGRTCSAQKLTVTSLSNTIIPTSTQRATNPAGIFWTDQALDLQDNVTINGMLRSTSGNVRVKGRNIVINRTDGFPAMMINDSLVYPSNNAQITVNGLCWIGGTLDHANNSNKCVLVVNGALIVQQGITSGYSGTITVTYDASKVKVPDFSGVNAIPAAVRIINYNPSN